MLGSKMECPHQRFGFMLCLGFAVVGLFAAWLVLAGGRGEHDHHHEHAPHSHAHELKVVCPETTTAFHRHAGLLLQDQVEILEGVKGELQELRRNCPPRAEEEHQH
ncbi:MAG: hypothetical protein GY871_04360 [Actinomycetales bacterium]|nr:hypothetical protein [Actinomycetales bacterium]